MRGTVVGCVAALMTGCSVLEQMAQNDSAMLDPSKIYLGGADLVNTRKYDIERYACLTGLLICNSRGAYYECACQN
jgi:hypothetical protein